MSEFSEKEPDKATISMGPAYLRPIEEKEHFGLYRDLLVEKRDPKTGKRTKETVQPPVGPLMVFRIARGDERVDMRTIHPETQQELKLHKVWDARTGDEN